MFTACGIMHRRCCRPVVHLNQTTGRQHLRCITTEAVNTVCAPEDGCNYRPKHVELIGIINKALLLHLVGCLYYRYLELHCQCKHPFTYVIFVLHSKKTGVEISFSLRECSL